MFVPQSYLFVDRQADIAHDLDVLKQNFLKASYLCLSIVKTIIFSVSEHMMKQQRNSNHILIEEYNILY